MYQVIIFSGGVYRFDEFVEFVEDLGGMVLKKDSFEISRGEYFLGEEIRVITIIPSKEEERIESLAREIRGKIEKSDIEMQKKSKILACLEVYGLLTNSPLMEKKRIKESLECPCTVQICDITNKTCLYYDLDEIIQAMVEMELLEKKIKNGKTEYIIK